MNMHPGRLFWKFFALISVVQLLSHAALHGWIEHQVASEIAARAVSSTQNAISFDDSQHKHGGFFPPMVDVLASLNCALLLAWLLSKPIRTLHSALSEAAGGNLDIRIADRMGSRKDELKDLGVVFDRMMAQLHSLIEAQRRLLNDVSHEIRSPMARIQAAVGLAQQQPDLALPLMERIERESVRIDRLVGELLALSRLQAGIDHKLNQEIDLRELLSDIIDDAQFEASAKGRCLQVGAEMAGSVRGNVELLRRAVENVVRNAIKFSHRGGTVTVESSLAAERHAAVISVQDTGTGVPESDLANIFDPFFRSSSHVHKEGSGLGLEIAKRVIQSHGGRISAANMPMGGLCVSIELPLLPANT